jgi:hypothetical protein
MQQNSREMWRAETGPYSHSYSQALLDHDTRGKLSLTVA